MPASEKRTKPKPQREGDNSRLEYIMDRVIAHTLPPAHGTILVLTFPPDTQFDDPNVAAGITLLIEGTKERHGFAGVIALSHGHTLRSFDKEGLAELGLQVIPSGATEGTANVDMG
jgi:hypothetical protein